jgi:hypothetical protein
MCRLLVHVEGETEETFVNEILRPHLVQKGYTYVSARIIGNARQRDRRGGIRGWNAVKNDIIKHLSGDRDCIATTMVDYYGLPKTGDKAWPNREAAGSLVFSLKAKTVEEGMRNDIVTEMGENFNGNRFIPFVVMHEFEGLLFSDCEAFANAIGKRDLASQLLAIRNQFTTPEEINDSPLTAPSKRVESIISGYQKPFFGSLAALEIGLEKIIDSCPHFKEWLLELERIGSIQ